MRDSRAAHGEGKGSVIESVFTGVLRSIALGGLPPSQAQPDALSVQPQLEQGDGLAEPLYLGYGAWCRLG